MKRKAALLLLLLIAAQAFGEQLTKVGVVDLSKILTAFYTKSQAVKELMDYWTETDAQLGKIRKEISDLEGLAEKAKNDKDDRAALDYDKKISERKEYQRDFYRYRKLEYDKKYDNIMKSSGFYSEILRAIEIVAVRDSFSLIIKTSDPSIIYYSKDIDITQDVIEILNR